MAALLRKIGTHARCNPRQPLAQQPRDAICGKRASRPCPARQADATGAPLPHPCLAETLTPRPGTVRPRQTAWLSRLDRSSLSSPEAIAATAARSTPMIASQSVAAARVNRPARADAKAGSAPVARERSAGHRHPATAATLCRETDCAAAGRSASPAGLRERRHRSARCRARWRKRSSWRKIRRCRGVPASSELISSITKARVPRSRRRRKAGARQATLSPA